MAGQAARSPEIDWMERVAHALERVGVKGGSVGKGSSVVLISGSSRMPPPEGRGISLGNLAVRWSVNGKISFHGVSGSKSPVVGWVSLCCGR